MDRHAADRLPPFLSTRVDRSERSVTDTEADEMEDHLRGLSYLE
jgi:hypothetical protein